MKKLASLLLGSSATLLPVIPAFAASTINPCPTGLGGSMCNIQSNGFGTIVSNIITILIIGAIVIAVVFLVWGGIKWILSGGDKSKVESARGTIIGAIIGLVIVFLSYFLISIVAGIFGISINNLTLPQLLQ
jgi:hypothetical protein